VNGRFGELVAGCLLPLPSVNNIRRELVLRGGGPGELSANFGDFVKTGLHNFQDIVTI
jgi:hypothetical protein